MVEQARTQMANNSTIELNQLLLLPGQVFCYKTLAGQNEEIISELGSHRASKLPYDQGC